ncbi:MipA/OmpV family protein [Novosphingobium sp. JCM 18896]|uniref:MipA/OmpV family protein n=1 Tax=Novosphingobium sp. JCM 18896 TaxID=2989731 RepID=UPI0022220F4F|nr:MipA/OmpV family protein [Novosphingobium sp. JCM 18896]MCW1430330.1 MipA/OmpV family protein [Novosphingobium sp. JCM 18896]
MRRILLPAIAFAASAVPALAQDVAAPADPAQAETPAQADAVLESSVFDGDFLVVAAGAVSMPSYEGSDNRSITPAGGVFGRIAGVGINPRAAGLALDFIPDQKGERLSFNLGPVARYRANRTGSIKDPVVAQLGKLDGVIEGGVAAGFSLKGVLTAFDRISVGADVRWDISGKGGGRVIAPGMTYFTPVSKGQVIGARVGAEFVDRKYAQYNYGIDAAGSAASGLPQYQGRGGFKEWNVGAFTAIDLSGNFLDGGFALGVGAQYSRLQGSAAETPITAIRGKRGQFFVGGGLAYTF